MRLSLAGLWLTGSATTVVYPSVPSLLVPIIAGERHMWASLSFTESTSRLWAPSDCPPSVVCIEALLASLSVRLSHSRDQRAIRPMALVADTDGWFRHTAGVLAVGPRSDFMAGRMLTFRLRGGQVSVQLSSPVACSASHWRDAILPGAQRWEFAGSLMFHFFQISRKYSAPVVMALDTQDLTFPLAWYRESPRRFRGVLDETNRLHRNCRHRSRIGAEALLLSIQTGHSDVAVPVVWVSGPSRTEGGKRYCPVSLRFHAALQMELGRTVLERHDVGLDARNGLIHFGSISESFRPLLAGPTPPAVVFLQNFACEISVENLRCRGYVATHPGGAEFELVSYGGLHVRLAGLHGSVVHMAHIPAGPYSDPVVHFHAGKVLSVSASRAAGGRYSLKVTATEHGTRIEFYTEDALLGDPGDVCAVCLEDLRSAPLRELAACSHVFHTDCVSRWMATKHSCPICRTPTAR